MPCGCNNLCPAENCPANFACYGDEPACSNSYNFTALPNNPVGVGIIIEAQHLEDLEDAINGERTDGSRRYNATPAFCIPDTATPACTNNSFVAYNFTSFSGNRAIGDLIKAIHINNVVAANNEVVTNSGYGQSSSVSVSIGTIITAAQVTQLQSDINTTRNACICNSFASCSPHCCNIYCPSDDAGYP
jgi:hypothetical protein